MQPSVRTALAVLCLLISAAQAQHIPEDQITVTQNPEHELAGVRVYGMKLKDVIALYGKPASQEKDKQGLPLYIWQKSGIKLQVGTAYDNPENVYAVDVWGSKPVGRLGKTSQGLALGCKLECVKKIYGPKVIQISPTEAMVVFSDDTDLRVGLGEGGRINHISLAGAVE
jgi:hypothetical protein